jgi:hypothetical protein
MAIAMIAATATAAVTGRTFYFAVAPCGAPAPQGCLTDERYHMQWTILSFGDGYITIILGINPFSFAAPTQDKTRHNNP